MSALVIHLHSLPLNMLAPWLCMQAQHKRVNPDHGMPDSTPA